ncbi:hypothetical protein PAXRUDRAFT_827885 [Paxillus rubicundulus Ve08.2h10]|uniref:Unplaced genomic scaffold scaffold_276, whole genome shotgun sequence n=1 Tax=Paxillus rubicundulus Ve08.2h10 TaxID=930991 RepID=A0A0D0DX36_9AGAM|nr:hypothetical protein PAXRUDRAFT_827885 [Paxillus rubicundulus Ve08.2h10]
MDIYHTTNSQESIISSAPDSTSVAAERTEVNRSGYKVQTKSTARRSGNPANQQPRTVLQSARC